MAGLSPLRACKTASEAANFTDSPQNAPSASTFCMCVYMCVSSIKKSCPCCFPSVVLRLLGAGSASRYALPLREIYRVRECGFFYYFFIYIYILLLFSFVIHTDLPQVKNACSVWRLPTLFQPWNKGAFCCFSGQDDIEGGFRGPPWGREPLLPHLVSRCMAPGSKKLLVHVTLPVLNTRLFDSPEGGYKESRIIISNASVLSSTQRQ